MFGLLIEFN